jgi:PAS domain S-box-containing protein
MKDPPPDVRTDSKDAPHWRAVHGIAGGLLVVLGCLGLLAWSLGEADYLQLDSRRPPLHYTAAFVFVLWGLAYLSLGCTWLRLARGLGVLLLLIGFPTLVASIASGTSPYRAVHGMSRYISFALCLSAAAIILTARARTSRSSTLFSTFIGAVLLLGCPAVLITQIGQAFVKPVGVSVLGVAGIAIATIPLLIASTRKGFQSFAPGNLLPIGMGVTGLVVTYALWLGLNADQNRRLHRQLQFEAANVQRLTQDRLADLITASNALAEDWIDPTQAARRSDLVGSHVGQMPSCLGVGVTNGTELEWIETRSPMLPKTFGELGASSALSEAIREGQAAAARPPRSNWGGNRMLIIFSPHRKGTPRGGLIAVLNLTDFLNAAINSNAAAGYALQITDHDGPIYTRYESDRSEQARLVELLPLKFEQFDWRLTLWPTRDLLERESLSLPRLALVIGLLTSGLLALAVHLARMARKRNVALEREIHERELAQNALSHSEQKYRSLIENLGQGVFLLDRDQRYVAANPQFCRSVGRTEVEILGACETDLYDPQRAASHMDEVRTVLVEGKNVETEEEVHVQGRKACIRRVLTPVRDAAGRTSGVLGICWDVTEQRQLEAHVHQASKMDAIGQLAGGIAHDFNNLLTVIVGNLELILAGSSPSDTEHELALAARNAASRATSLTQRLLGFSRRHQLDWAATNVDIVVEEVVSLLRRTIDPLIRIETRCAAGCWNVLGDSTQLNQVLMNLCLNARDAIAGAGRISIETACVGAAELPGTCNRAGRIGEFVRLSISDDGCGMTAEVKARMFEPFFTTKEVGKGTGLGLPMVFAIVRQHKGWIDCWSEPGRGTRFDIYLPRGEASKVVVPEAVETTPTRKGKETILVVDDEEMIRQLAAATLQSRGYSVIQAEDGQQAVDIYTREADRIDLVILDLTMPILSGHEAFRHLLALDPRVRVLFASGYAVEQLTELEKELMAGFVNKPYRPTELILAVEEAIPRRGSECGDPGETGLLDIPPHNLHKAPVLERHASLLSGLSQSTPKP